MDAITFEQFCDDNEITGRDKNNFKKYASKDLTRDGGTYWYGSELKDNSMNYPEDWNVIYKESLKQSFVKSDADKLSGLKNKLSGNALRLQEDLDGVQKRIDKMSDASDVSWVEDELKNLEYDVHNMLTSLPHLAR